MTDRRIRVLVADDSETVRAAIRALFAEDPALEVVGEAADGVEAVARGHAYDGLIAYAGCDKTLPGMMMAMVRLNLPAAFVYGGAALPGRWRGNDVTVLDTYEAVGAVLAGDMQQAELDELERACLPTIGACPGQFSANTMAMVSETPAI